MSRHCMPNINLNTIGAKIMSKKDATKNPASVDSKSEPIKDEDKGAVNDTPKKDEPMLLSVVVKGLKAVVLKANGGKRPLNPVARKSRATKALVGAMLTRNWIDKGKGVYTLNGVTVNTDTKEFEVEIKDGVKSYALALGKGAIIELDSYMKLR